MRTRPIAAALVIAFTPAAFTLPALAQPAVADDPMTEMARARFKEGVDFYDKGEFEQARASFLQAYALKKHPAVLLNLAWSCLKSGHVLEAERYFKQFLAEGDEISDKQRADANDGVNQAHAKLGRIEVVAPAGTDVTLDGDHAGTTPLPAAPYVEPGAHTVKFKEADGTTDTDSVTVLAGEKAIARLTKTAASPAPASAAEPSPPPAAPSSSEETAPAEAPSPRPAPSAEVSPTGHHASVFSAPENWTPVVIGAVITLAGAGVAIGMSFSKRSAQQKADDTAADIRANGGTSCVPPTPASLNGLAAACTSFVNDNNNINADATIGNIALGVGIAALAGTVLYYLIADKRGDSPSAQSLRVVPEVGPSTGGLSLGATF